MKKDQIGLQIWTLRDVLPNDFKGTYERVARMGYAGVEIGDTGPMTLPDFKKMLDDLGLRCIGSHCMMDGLLNDRQSLVDRALALGSSYLTLAMMSNPGERDPKVLHELAAKLAEIAQDIAKQGVQLCYHNHNFEFEKAGCQFVYECLFFDPLVPPALKAELDVYWATFGNQDPVAWIHRMKGRLPLLHMKDMAPGAERTFCEVGAGTIDMPSVVKAGDEEGVAWFIVEQDVCKTDPMGCVEFSCKTLTKLAKE